MLAMPDLPDTQVRFEGDATGSKMGQAMCQAFYRALHGDSALPMPLYDVEGFSGRRFRMFLNNLCASVTDACYLEIGVFKGGSFLPAIYGNAMSATALDNWSWPKADFNKFKSYLDELAAGVDVSLINKDFRAVDFGSIGPFNVMFYDGSHDEADQLDGVKLPVAAMRDEYVVIVDDWNWPHVRRGTFAGLEAAGCRIQASIELFTSRDGQLPAMKHRGSKSDWHNGMFAATVRRPA